MKYATTSITNLLLLPALVVGALLTSSCSRSPDAGVAEVPEVVAPKLAGDASPYVRFHSPTLGSKSARVHLVEFFDPACEACAAFSPFVKDLMAANPGKIRLVLRYAPFHKGSDYIVKVLEASRKQGKYWQTLEILFKSQPYWASHHNPQPEKIWQFLSQAGMDIERIREDMNDPAFDKIIQQDLADAKTLRVDKTPGFFANGKPLVQFGYKQLQALVESEIAASYAQ